MHALLLVILFADSGLSEYRRCANPEGDSSALTEVSLEVSRLARHHGFGWDGPRGRGYVDGKPVPEPTPLPFERIVDSIEALLRRPCFALAIENRRWKRPDSVESLVEWWRNGGEVWLVSYVSPSDRIVLPPDVRRTLAVGGKEKHPLAPILCKDGDAACGTETRCWARRAEQALYLHAVENGRMPPRRGGDERPACLQKRYPEWRACVEERRDIRPMLPLGSFRAPEGWIVIRGRRGHYSFCDEVRAYDLSTGSAWIAQSCSALVLTDGGGVDGAATDAKRGVRARAGTVPRDAIREAVWMLLLASEVEHAVQPYAQYEPLPSGMEPRMPAGGATSLFGLGGWGTSAQTQLRWGWFRLGRLQHSGTLTWPDSSDGGENHAAELLAIAEDGFTAGCPPASPPREIIALSSAGEVSPLDASGDRVRRAQDELVAALRSLRPCE